MTYYSDALNEVFEMLRGDTWAIDGEWGCGHTYEEALARNSDYFTGGGCYVHDRAVRIEELARLLEVQS